MPVAGTDRVCGRLCVLSRQIDWTECHLERTFDVVGGPEMSTGADVWTTECPFGETDRVFGRVGMRGGLAGLVCRSAGVGCGLADVP